MPMLKDTPALHALREGDAETFHRHIHEDGGADLVNANLSGCDLKSCRLNGLDLTGAYLAYADLRGLDLRECNLEGASIKHAQISGVYFPETLGPDEIRLSNEKGTRLRVRKAA